MNWAQLFVSIWRVLFKTNTPAPAPSGSKPLPQRTPATPFLETLRAEAWRPLSHDDFRRFAGRLGCRWEALAAVAEVESGRLGAFDPHGRPIILFERHLFSRKTRGLFDATHPNVSNPNAGGYPPGQEERWAQLRQAFALDPEAALESASWGRFQLLGQNFATLGFGNARDYVAKLARSEVDQLEAFEAFIRSNGLVPALQRLDWAAFARGYNGPAYARNRYDQRMAEAFARIAGQALA